MNNFETNLCEISLNDIKNIELFYKDSFIHRFIYENFYLKIDIRSPECFSITDKDILNDLSLETDVLNCSISFNFYSIPTKRFQIQKFEKKRKSSNSYDFIFLVREDINKENELMSGTDLSSIRVSGNGNIINNNSDKNQNYVQESGNLIELQKELQNIRQQLQNLNDDKTKKKAMEIFEKINKDKPKDWINYLGKLLEIGGKVVQIVLPFYTKIKGLS